MIIECLLLSVSLCHALRDRPVVALTVTSAVAMAVDGQLTRQNARMYQREGLTASSETDPVTRLVIGRYPTWKRMAPAGLALIVTEAVVAEKLRRSHSWLRHVWWVPQALTIAGNAWGISTFYKVSK